MFFCDLCGFLFVLWKNSFIFVKLICTSLLYLPAFLKATQNFLSLFNVGLAALFFTFARCFKRYFVVVFIYVGRSSDKLSLLIRIFNVRSQSSTAFGQFCFFLFRWHFRFLIGAWWCVW